MARTCAAAARGGNLERLKTLRTTNTPWSFLCTDLNSRGAPVLEYLYLNGFVAIGKDWLETCDQLRTSMLEDRRLSVFSECMSKRPEDIEQAELARFKTLLYQIQCTLKFSAPTSVLREAILTFV